MKTETSCGRTDVRIQRNSFRAWATLCVVVSACLRTHAQVPIPEDYLPAGRGEEYLQAAVRFLEQQAADRFAPRVAFDLYTVSSSMGQKAVAEAARSRLLFDYPQSFQAGYLYTTFEDAGNFRSFLNEQAEQQFEKNPAQLPEKFCQVYKIGLQRFRGSSELAGDFSLLLKAYAFSQITQDAELASLARRELSLKRIEVEEGPALETLDACMDRDLDPLDRVLRLNAVEDNADARFIKKVFMARLPAQMQADPRIIRIFAEDALRSKDFPGALAQIAKLPPDAQNDAQVLFWTARCQFAQGSDAAAVKTLGELYKLHPQSPWAASAKAYGEGILQLPANRKVHVEALHAFAKGMLEGLDVFQATLEYRAEPGDEVKYVVYLGVMQSQNYLEVSVRSKESFLFAYRTGGSESALFLKDQGKIYQFAQPGPIPAPRFNLEKKPDGTFYISADASIEPSFEHAKRKNEGLLNSPFLKTPEGLGLLFDYTIRKLGVCPLAPVATDGGRSFAWLVPRVGQPELDRLQFELGGEGSLKGIEFPQFRLAGVEYGPAGKARLTPPPWPQVPVEQEQELDAALLMQVFSSLAALASKR